MKRRILKIVAAVLMTAMLLSGCSAVGSWIRDVIERIEAGVPVSFSNMEYTRPDMTAFRTMLDECCTMSQKETDAEALMVEVWNFFTLYHEIYTNYMLADIHYCKDMTDIYWSNEYSYCLEIISEVDAGMDRLLYTLADSPLRQELEAEKYFGAGYFDAYTGDSMWDETFTALAQQEAALLDRYYAISGKAAGDMAYTKEFFDTYTQPLGEVFVELVAVRQQMARAAGYEDYPSFAYDAYYYRDYTPAQTAAYLREIQKELVPLYKELALSDAWAEAGESPCDPQQTYAYVKELAESAGGNIQKAFRLMDVAGLYDIAPGANKYNASFEMYLSAYYEPFIFMNPTGYARDQLTFAHEFGHFCNDYVSGGTVVGVDVAEIFSQSMEYLSLTYTQKGQTLQTMKMADSLCVFVEQAAYASFEQQVYALEGKDLTLENVIALYERIGREHGFDGSGWDARDFVIVPHFFTNPMYVVSYVVSNDAAMQIYQRETEDKGAGLKLLEDNFATEEVGVLAFVGSAGLESPFAPGRVQQLRDLLQAQLQLSSKLSNAA